MLLWKINDVNKRIKSLCIFKMENIEDIKKDHLTNFLYSRRERMTIRHQLLFLKQKLVASALKPKLI